MSKHVGFLLNLIAIGLFVPGIMLPMFTLAMDVSANVGSTNFTSGLVNKELSLIGTITELWQDNRIAVAILIFLFSVVIPVIKTLLITISYFIKNQNISQRMVNFVAVIGKWSMADVFVVAIFLAVLSTNNAETANHQQLNLFGFKLDLVISSETLSNVGVGFYYFTAYCLVSLLGTQISQLAQKSSGIATAK